MFELTHRQSKHAERTSPPSQTLDHLVPGERATVDRIAAASQTIRQRLLEMGLTRGTVIEVIRFAPLGDPMEIAVRGYRLSLRRTEAQSVVIRKESR